MTFRIALAIAVAALAALAVAGRADAALTRTIVAGHAVIGVAALILNIVTRRRLRDAVTRVQTATPVVATGIVEAPQLDTADLIAAVRSLGFELAGATDTMLRDAPIRTWVLLEPSGETWVEVGHASVPIAIFLTVVSGDRLVETSFPRGATIDDPRLLAAPIATSPADALAAHRRIVASLGGGRRPVSTLDDYLVAEAEQRVRTGGMRIRDHLARVVEPSIRDWAISVAVDAVAMAALFWLRARG
jgi:hypothetical protein